MSFLWRPGLVENHFCTGILDIRGQSVDGFTHFLGLGDRETMAILNDYVIPFLCVQKLQDLFAGCSILI